MNESRSTAPRHTPSSIASAPVTSFFSSANALPSVDLEAALLLVDKRLLIFGRQQRARLLLARRRQQQRHKRHKHAAGVDRAHVELVERLRREHAALKVRRHARAPRVQRLKRPQRRLDVAVAARRAARLGAAVDLERGRVAQQPRHVDLDRVHHARLGPRRLVARRDDLDRARAALQHDALVRVGAAEAHELVLDRERPDPLFDRRHGLVRAFVAVAPLGHVLGLGLDFAHHLLHKLAPLLRHELNRH